MVGRHEDGEGARQRQEICLSELGGTVLRELGRHFRMELHKYHPRKDLRIYSRQRIVLLLHCFSGTLVLPL